MKLTGSWKVFFSILDNLDEEALSLVKKDTEMCLDSKKKSTQNRAQKILKRIDKMRAIQV